MAMRDHYKKAYWHTSGVTFYERHLLFDEHHGEQLEMMDTLAEHVRTLGGVAPWFIHQHLSARSDAL
jgi:starvation-inducible DNA-binding protein